MSGLSESQVEIKDWSGDGDFVQLTDGVDFTKKLNVLAAGDAALLAKGLVLLGLDPSNNAKAMSFDLAGNLKVTGGGGGFEVLDGQLAVPLTDLGGIIAGFDGTNYQFIKTDSDGNLQVDILSGSDEQHLWGDLITDGKGTVAMGSDGANFYFLLTDSHGILGTEIYTGGSPIDPRQIRALTTSDVVKVHLQDDGGAAITLGQQAMATSLPVVVANNQSAIPVSQSGTWTVQPGNTPNTVPWLVTDSSDGPVTPGAVASKSGLMGGQYNLSLPTLATTQQSALQLDSNGRLIIRPLVQTDEISVVQSGAWVVSLSPSTRESYSAAASFACAAAATDVFTIAGSAAKRSIVITRIAISGTTSAASGITINCALIKRSQVDIGGTLDTNVPHDSNNSSGVAVVKHYTANPILGAAVGNIRSDCLFIANSASANPQGSLVWDFGTRPAQAIVLNNANEQLCINFSAATISAPVIDISVEWAEI
jgi:hypothetical protein